MINTDLFIGLALCKLYMKELEKSGWKIISMWDDYNKDRETQNINTVLRSLEHDSSFVHVVFKNKNEIAWVVFNAENAGYCLHDYSITNKYGFDHIIEKIAYAIDKRKLKIEIKIEG